MAALLQLFSNNRGRYDRPEFGQSAANRIVHIGVGGFHRAHQALYTHLVAEMFSKLEWSICGIGLLDGDRKMQQTLTQQHGLYTLVSRGSKEHFAQSFLPFVHSEKSEETKDFEDVRIIGSITEFVLAADSMTVAIEKLTDKRTKIIALTVTESGYYLNSEQQLDFGHPAIIEDLVNFTTNPKTAIGFLAVGLERRRRLNHDGVTLLSCDNIPENGNRLKRALLDFCFKLGRQELCEYLENNCSFPNSVVDCITPATKPEVVEHLKEKYQIVDEWPVLCETFHSWVIEDQFVAGRPNWEQVGVQFVPDARPYELTKLRLLNGAHSAMAYVSALCGYTTVHDALEDSLIGQLVAGYMHEMQKALPILDDVNQQDYCRIVLERFLNREIGDRISRLAMDGSSKIAFFISEGTQQLLNGGHETKHIAFALAAWICYLCGKGETEQLEIVDPRGKQLTQLANEAVSGGTNEPANVKAFMQSALPELTKYDKFIKKMNEYVTSIFYYGVQSALKELFDIPD